MRQSVTPWWCLLVAVSASAPARAQPVGAGPGPGQAELEESETAFVGSRRQVSLREALEVAARKSPDLQAARAQALQVAAKARLASSVLLPELKASATYVLTSAEQKFVTGGFLSAFEGSIESAIRGSGPAYGNFLPPNEAVVAAVKSGFTEQAGDGFKDTTIVARNSLYGSLVVSQVLFSPQFWMLPAANKAAEAAKLGSSEAREQVLLGVARVYLGLEGLTQLERAARDALAVSLRREKDAKAQASVGTSTEINVLRAQTETAQARSLMVTLASQRIALLAMLEALVAEPVRPIDGSPTALSVQAADEASAPWEQTFLVKSQRMALSSQEHLNTFDRLSWAPTVVVQGKGSYNSNSGFSGRNFMVDGIVAAEWTLYDRGVRYATLHENDAKTLQYRAQLEAAQAKAKAAWIAAKTSLLAAEVTSAQAEAQAQLATRAQKQADAARQVGMLTALELSDIDSRRFLAASSAAQARAQVEVRKVELAAAEGRLARTFGIPEE
jgi:outer membrane protein